jgi:hypothetical protein
MRYLIILCFACFLVLAACSGRDKIATDTTAPFPPILIPHLGDTGDSPVEYNGQTIVLNEDNNGIDTDPDGDWIKVSWQHFLDTDLNYVKIYRFDDDSNQTVHLTTLVDSVGVGNLQGDYYLDSNNQLSTDVRYSYFIEVFDNAGNSALSDTVSYALLSKQIPMSPENGSTADPNSITFEWQRSGFVSKIRVLVFDDTHQYLWHRDIDVAFEDDIMTTSMPSNWVQSLHYTGNLVYWRVDAFEWDNELQFFAGSESNEQILYLNRK